MGSGKDSAIEPISTIWPRPRAAMAAASALAPVTGATKFTSAIAREASGVSAAASSGAVPPKPGIEDGEVNRRRRIGGGKARDLRI